ncbi:MAG: DUF86 domain-containing protein [Methanomassiliicoccaceae archaeon]|jgi:uncharacterized protein with HEPN domain|nr:DUF86 domain-containing protein [Methanomassiliicoccaceae archaeon]
MRPEIKRLETIVKYCERIEYYLNKYGDDEDEFLMNVDLQEGCAFCLIQIGEAVTHLPDDVRVLRKDMEWKDIKGMRNILAHRYGTVWLTGVWQTITEDIPILKDVCVSLLKILKT